MPAHHSIIPLRIEGQAREAIPALLADTSIADALRPYVNGTAAELAAIGPKSTAANPLDAAGQGGRLESAPLASGEAGSSPLPPSLILPGFQATSRCRGPVSSAGSSWTGGRPRILRRQYEGDLPAPTSADGGPSIRPGAGTGPWGPAAFAFLASVRDGLVAADSSGTLSTGGSQPPVDRMSGPPAGLTTEVSAGVPSSVLQASGPAPADLGPLLSRPGEGLAGLFDSASDGPSASPFNPTGSTGGFTAGTRGGPVPAEEMQPGIASGPSANGGGSATADAETIADLASRLVLAAERLEQAAGRLAPRGPYPLASAPRPFPGRVDA